MIAQLKIGPARTTASRWARSSRASTSTRARLRRSRRRGGAKLVVDGRGMRVPGTRAGSSSGRACSTTSSRTCASTRRRSSGRCSASCACRTSDGAAARQRARVRQRHGDLHARWRGRAHVHPGRAGRHGRRQRADSRADGLPLLRRLEALAVRRPARARSGRRALLHATEDRHFALADRRIARAAQFVMPTMKSRCPRAPPPRPCPLEPPRDWGRAQMELRSSRAAVAQLDRASGFEPEGRGFESLRARQSPPRRKRATSRRPFLVSHPPDGGSPRQNRQAADTHSAFASSTSSMSMTSYSRRVCRCSKSVRPTPAP